MRGFVIVVTATMCFATAAFEVSGQDTKSKAQTKPGTQPAAKPNAAVPSKAGAVKEPDASPAAQKAQDEAAIRMAGDSYVKSFNQRDSKAVAEHYTTDAEYIDEKGILIQSRTAIEESLKAFFTASPECTLSLNIVSVRFVGPGIAIEDGSASVKISQDAEPSITRYTAVHSKVSGKWLLASIRDAALKQPGEHRSKLKQLEWMLGEWVHEGSDAVIIFTCKSVDNGNFLLRDFTIKIAGQDAMSGSQRIGWDAQAGKFKAWIFDSDGGHSEGYWHRDGDNWVLKTSGVTSDGHSASSTSLYTYVNAHTMTFQSADHEVSGVEYPDSPKVKIVRHPPRPE